MSGVSADRVTIDIDHQLSGLPCTPSKPSIHRVDSHLRSGGWDYIYDPEILSIGPYHHGDSRLQSTSQLKYVYLKRLQSRKNEQSVEKYVNAVAAMEKQARNCYAEPIGVDGNEFVTLLVLDGIFLIELFRCYHSKNLRDMNDYIFSHESIRSQLRHDILLLENQIPFFVLNQLFNMTKSNDDDEDDDLIKLALEFFDGVFVKNLSTSRVREGLSHKNIDHLFGLIHDSWCLPFAEKMLKSGGYNSNFEGLKWDNIKSISMLRDAGIRIEKAKQNDDFMDINFMKDALRIPQLSIFDETESLLRNLIAYEQYFPDMKKRYVSDYLFFMHCLIKNSNDVEFLSGRGIIDNCLGPDEEICQMFNRLGKNILISQEFCYFQVFCSLNRQCRRRGKRWKANLRRNYFNSPWSIISFLAAAALLMLAFTQTAYTVLSYYNRKK